MIYFLYNILWNEFQHFFINGINHIAFFRSNAINYIATKSVVPTGLAALH